MQVFWDSLVLMDSDESHGVAIIDFCCGFGGAAKSQLAAEGPFWLYLLRLTSQPGLDGGN